MTEPIGKGATCIPRMSRQHLSRRALVLSAGALAAWTAIPGRPVFGAVDGRTVNPMKLRLVEWLNLGKSDRGIFLRGFSVGWYRGLASDSDAIRRGNPDALLDSIDLQITKLANLPETAHSPLVTALTRATLLGWLPPLELLGGEWMKFQMRHRILSLQALVAGAHSEAVWREVGKPRDSATLNKSFARARWIVRSPLPLNPNLMLSRLDDYFEDDERLETSLSHAVLIVDSGGVGAVPRDSAPAAPVVPKSAEDAEEG